MRGELAALVILLFATANLAALGIVAVGRDVGVIAYAIGVLVLLNPLVAVGALKLGRAAGAPRAAARRDLVEEAMAPLSIALAIAAVIWLPFVLTPDRFAYLSLNYPDTAARAFLSVGELAALPATCVVLAHFVRGLDRGSQDGG